MSKASKEVRLVLAMANEYEKAIAAVTATCQQQASVIEVLMPFSFQVMKHPGHGWFVIYLIADSPRPDLFENSGVEILRNFLRSELGYETRLPELER